MKQTYYSIRAVQADSLMQAVCKIDNEQFDETNNLCDKVLTAKQLEQELARQKPVIQWVVKVNDLKQHKKNTENVNKEGYLQFIGKIVCYTRGVAIKKARLFDGKIEKLTVKFDKKKHIII